MRLATLDGSPVLVQTGRHCAVPAASGGRYPTTRAILEDWNGFVTWHGQAEPVLSWAVTPDGTRWGPPVPDPGQVLGVGLNYAEHKVESSSLLRAGDSGMPMVFTKWASSICGPEDDIELQGDACDFEVELVLVIGRTADRVAADDALRHVAGVMVGQDVSQRRLQHGSPAQLGVAKSMRTFAPTGPHLVTLDEAGDLDRLAIECRVNGRTQQSDTTGSLILGPAELVALLSGVGPLRPGDLVFTGTPAGVGHRQDPPRFLRPGDVVDSTIEGLGALHNHCTTSPGRLPGVLATALEGTA
ncbi:MAG: fumarylacetoacetate hydrolase family protein [Nocardioides sp.]